MTKEEALRDNQMSKTLHNENIIKELEKIKAEISFLAKGRDKEAIYAIDVFDIISSHIAELKGE